MSSHQSKISTTNWMWLYQVSEHVQRTLSLYHGVQELFFQRHSQFWRHRIRDSLSLRHCNAHNRPFYYSWSQLAEMLAELFRPPVTSPSWIIWCHPYFVIHPCLQTSCDYYMTLVLVGSEGLFDSLHILHLFLPFSPSNGPAAALDFPFSMYWKKI